MSIKYKLYSPHAAPPSPDASQASPSQLPPVPGTHATFIFETRLIQSHAC